MRLTIAASVFAIAAFAQDRMREKEIALAAGLAADFRQRVPIVDNPGLRTRAEKIANQLNEFARVRGPLTVEITRSEVAGFPNGQLFVPGAEPRQIAHALAHAASPPVSRQQAAGPLIVFGGWLHHSDDAIVPLAMRAAQREHEQRVQRLADEWTARLRGLLLPVAKDHQQQDRDPGGARR